MSFFGCSSFRSSVFAPLPPPPGGIGSINILLRRTFSSSGVGFFKPIHKFHNPFPFPLILNICNFLLLLRVILSTRYKGKILFFSSEGFSFFEKVVWAITALLLRRRPIIFLVSGLFPTSWSNTPFLLKFILKSLVNRSSICLLSQSSSWLSYYQDLFPSCQHRVAPATVDLSPFSNRHKVSNFFNPKLIYVGWITKYKGILDLLDALKVVSLSFPSIHVELVGPTFGNNSYWLNEISMRNLSNNVILCGSIEDRSLLLSRIVESTIFVFPSHFEGLPVSLIEAISLGLPCISSNAGGCSDVLDAGRAGLVVNISSPGEMSSAIIKLLDSYPLRCYYSNAATAHFDLNFSIDNFKSKFSEILS